MTPLDAMRIYADKYISADWQSIAPFNFQGTLPYVYIFRKDKDIDLKSRTICSTADHPLKRVSTYMTQDFSLSSLKPIAGIPR